MADLINNMNLEILKMPLGFIKVIEFPFAILAFATVTGWGVKTGYQITDVKDTKCKEVIIEWSYGFSMTDIAIPEDSCSATSPMTNVFEQGHSFSAGFFVFVGVVSMLYALIAVLVYLFLWAHYDNDPRYATVDLFVTVVLAACWLLGTLGWWVGVGGLAAETAPIILLQEIQEKDKGCEAGICYLGLYDKDDYGSGALTISVIAGLACVLLWVGNCWFVYKETHFWKNRQMPPASVVGGSAPGAHQDHLPTGPPVGYQ